MALDRRAALKLLAGGAAAAAGTAVVTSGTAFADGGTAARRPTCTTTAGQVTWSTVSTNNEIDITISPGTHTCPTAGWTASRDIMGTASSGTTGVAFFNGGTNVNGVWTNGVVATGNLRKVRGTGSSTDIGTGGGSYSIAVSITIRRRCTSGGRIAWCCTLYTRTATYSRGGTDTWGGATTGNFGGGTTPNACATP